MFKRYRFGADPAAAQTHYPPEAGAGAGGSSAAGSSSAGGAPGAGAGAGDGAGGSGGSVYRVTDDSMVDFGDGKPVRYGDHKAGFMPRSKYDEGVAFLTTMAKQLDERAAGTGRGAQPKAQPPARSQAAAGSEDPFEGLESQAVIDGATLQKIGRKITGPLGQAIMSMGAKMTALESQVKALSGTTGSLAEHHQTQEFDSHLAKAIKELPELKGLGRIPDDPAVRELAADVWLSHDQKDPLLAREFSKMVSTRVEAMFSLFKKMQATAVEGAKEKRRAFFNPNGGRAAGSGAPAYQHKSGSELAAQFFGSAEPGT